MAENILEGQQQYCGQNIARSDIGCDGVITSATNIKIKKSHPNGGRCKSIVSVSTRISYDRLRKEFRVQYNI